MYVIERYAAMSSDDTATGTNQDLTITYPAAGMGRHHVISGVNYSFNALQLGAGVTLTISDGNNAIFRVYIIMGGMGTFYFDPPKQGLPNNALTVTLMAGGAGVVSALNVLGHWVD